jgi:nicotinamide mononucleotide (NMN) deamidase PncC
MARAARERLGADVGIGITGVAGPDPQDGKPPGPVPVAVDAAVIEPQGVSYQFAQGREAVKRRAVTVALTLRRQALLDWKGGGAS